MSPGHADHFYVLLIAHAIGGEGELIDVALGIDTDALSAFSNSFRLSGRTCSFKAMAVGESCSAR